jgi:hypothetical protein
MHGDPRDASLWKVMRDDGTVLGRYGNKPTAVAAMIRFSADGGGYQVVNESLADRSSDVESDPRQIIVPLREIE